MMTPSCLILLLSCSLLHNVLADVTANFDSATVDAETPICIDVLSNDVYTGGVTVTVANTSNGFAFVNYPPFYMLTRDFDAVIEAENYQLLNYRGQTTYSTAYNPAYWEVVVGQYSNLVGNGIRLWPNIQRDSGAGNYITGPAARYDIAFRAANPNYRAYARGQTCNGSNNSTVNNSCKTPVDDDSVGFMYGSNAVYSLARIDGFPAGNVSCDWKEFPVGFPINASQNTWPPTITPVWLTAVADGIVIDRIYISLKSGLETQLAGDIPTTQFVNCGSKEILYFPALGFSGFDSVPYTISDGVSSSTGYVDITVVAVSPSPTASVTPTRTPSRTPSPGSPSTTPSNSPSKSITPSISPSKSITPSMSPSRSNSPSPSNSRTPSPSMSPSRSPSRSVSPSASVTPSTSIPPSMDPTPSTSPSVTPSPIPSTSSTPSSSSSSSPSRTPSPSSSPSVTPSPIPSISPTSSPSLGASTTPTSTTTPSRSSSPSASPSLSPSPSNSASPIPPSSSPSPSPSPIVGPASNSASPGQSASSSSSPSGSPVVGSVSATPSPALNTPTIAPSSSSSPEAAGHSNRSKKNSTVIIGGVVGGAVAAALLVGALLCFVKRRRPKETNLPEVGNTEMMSYSVIPVPPGHDPSNYAVMSTQLSRQESFSSFSSFDKNQAQNLADVRESWVINYNDIKIIKKLGAGAHGEVWEGKWKGIQVAVKKLITIDDTDTSDFLAEAALMKKMRPHPNVVLYLGVCREPLCLVTEFVANGNLLTLIRKEPISDEMKLKICQGVAAGMFYLHEQGVLHRDLAARNILLDGLNNPKVCDFGMSRVAADDTAHKTSANVGPIRWMAPEALAERVSSPKTDVWSFGVVIYEILTRKLPYHKVGLPQVGAQVAMGKISLLQDFEEEIGEFPPKLLAVMKACLQHNPVDRPDFNRIVEMLDVVEVVQPPPEQN